MLVLDPLITLVHLQIHQEVLPTELTVAVVLQTQDLTHADHHTVAEVRQVVDPDHTVRQVRVLARVGRTVAEDHHQADLSVPAEVAVHHQVVVVADNEFYLI